MASKKSAPKAAPRATPSAAPSAGFSLREISQFIDHVHEKGFDEFELEQGPLRLRIVSNRAASTPVITYAAAPVHPVAPAPVAVAAPLAVAPAPVAEAVPAAPAGPAPLAANMREVKSPMVGTFYRAASPGSPSYANVGDRVSPETVVCIIEAMKLMNEIKAEVSGVVRKVCVENAQPVEYGQVLFLVEQD